jgi:uncharacterized RDD family membrane protein YckC
VAAIEGIQSAEADIQRIGAAPFVLRLAALLIDGLVLVVPITLLPGMSGELTLDEGIFMTVATALIMPIKVLPAVAILAVLEGLTGRTAGKMLTGLRIVGVEDGEPIGTLRAIGRRAFMVMESYVLFIPSLILIPFNRNFDGHLGDRLTGTIVARDADIARAFPVE